MLGVHLLLPLECNFGIKYVFHCWKLRLSFVSINGLGGLCFDGRMLISKCF